MPGPRVAGRRSRPRIYGENYIVLTKRAGQRHGWTTEVFDLYGKRAKKRYKTLRRHGDQPAVSSVSCWWTSVREQDNRREIRRS